MQYGFIGLGNMASAIIKGAITAGVVSPSEITGYDVLPGAAETLKKSTGISLCSSLEEAASAEVVILAVKPQMLTEVLARCRAVRKQEGARQRLYISIAAGKELDFLETCLGEEEAIIRVMPNINAKVQAATCAYTANRNVTDDHKEAAENLFRAVGTIMELPEHLFHCFTAVAGSGPAFCYLFIDALARAAVREGMTRGQALQAAASTVLGSAKMVLESREHPLELVDQVSSPGGTTVEGVCALQALGFENAVHEAVLAATLKSRNI